MSALQYPGVGTVFETYSSGGTASVLGRPWGWAAGFDAAGSMGTKPFLIPCESALMDASAGSGLYESTQDNVLGAARMKAKRTDGYTFTLSFPIGIPSPASPNAYDAIRNFICNFNGTALDYMSLGIGTSMWPADSLRLPLGVLENFTIKASGVGGAGPVTCTMQTRGITLGAVGSPVTGGTPKVGNPPGAATYFPDNFLTGASGIDPFGHFLDPNTNILNLPESRPANIKDCLLTFDGLRMEQVVDMSLQIKQTVVVEATSDGQLETNAAIKQGNYLFIKDREVTGTFSFLAASIVGVVGNYPLPWMKQRNLSNPSAFELSPVGSGQWASSLRMSFGPIWFQMPAVFWQPQVHDLKSSGSPLVKIRFKAGGNIFGVSEFLP
jgi:hypothetical protein